MSEKQLEVILATKRSGQCTSCKAKVSWYKLAASLKWHPFNGDPRVSTQQALVEDYETHWLPTSASHFATCPHADKWRKKQ